MSPDEKDPMFCMVRKCAEELIEHCDTVQIFVTNHRDDGTQSINHGLGNWYARYGQVSEWIIKNNEDAKENVRRANENHD